MAIALDPRTYFLVDRLSKLVALVLIVVFLEGSAGSIGPVLGVLGFLLGIATVYIEVEEDADESAVSQRDDA